MLWFWITVHICNFPRISRDHIAWLHWRKGWMLYSLYILQWTSPLATSSVLLLYDSSTQKFLFSILILVYSLDYIDGSILYSVWLGKKMSHVLAGSLHTHRHGPILSETARSYSLLLRMILIDEVSVSGWCYYDCPIATSIICCSWRMILSIAVPSTLQLFNEISAWQTFSQIEISWEKTVPLTGSENLCSLISSFHSVKHHWFVI